MGKGRGHKGGRRQFTNPHDITAQKEKEEKEKEWRRRRGEIESSSEDEESNSEEESSSEEEEAGTAAGGDKTDKPAAAEALIEVNNPNRVVKKPNKKDLDTLVDAKVELSRREREELDRQQAKDHYAKLTMEGKTEQARADLARLAVIRQQREEAAKKREEEKRVKEEAKKEAAASKTAATKSAAASVTVAGDKGKGRKK